MLNNKSLVAIGVVFVIIIFSSVILLSMADIKVTRKPPGNSVQSSVTPKESTGSASSTEASCVNKCGDGICQEIVCQGLTCPCAETTQSCPQDCK